MTLPAIPMSNAAAVLPLTCFLLMFVLRRRAVRRVSEHTDDTRASVIDACVLWGSAVVAITELLSLARAVGHRPLLATWAIFALALAAWALFGGRGEIDRGLQAVDEHSVDVQGPFDPPSSESSGVARGRWSDSTHTRLLVLSMVSVTALLGLLAVVAPPNNWDSMTYHMSRVAHWIQNGGVAHYPTTIDRQLFLSPWAEFAILQFQGLTGGDRWANLIQWASMVGCMCCASLIAKQLGGKWSVQLSTAAIVAAIPMGILQSSTTQNDYVTAFWFVCFVHYTLHLSSSPSSGPRVSAPLAGASLGLLLLTKGTGYVYALPFLVWLSWWSLRHDTVRRLRLLVNIGLIVASMNAWHFVRNWNAFNNVLGPPESVQSVANEVISPAIVLSNVIRNVALHLPTPSERVNNWSFRVIRRIHRAIGVDLNDPRTSFGDGQPPYRFTVPRLILQEDLTGNGLHLVLLTLSIAFLLTGTRGTDSRPARMYAIALLAGFGLFCAIFKWQPWGSRLHLPLFVLGAPLIAIVGARWLGPDGVPGAAALLLVVSLPWVMLNEARPLIRLRSAFWTNTVFDTPRSELYFSNRRRLAAPYIEASRRIREMGCANVGLVLGEDDYEYPIWALVGALGSPSMRLSHVVFSSDARAMAPGVAPPAASVRYCAVMTIDDAAPNALNALERAYADQWRMAPVTLFLRPR